MDIWDEIKKLSGYQSGNGGVDSYGVDHSGFSTRDELEYQSARLARENQLAESFAKQGISEENYPQFGTNFWGGSPENNYGFGTSNIKQNIENVTNRLNNGDFSGGMNGGGFNVGANNGQVTTNSDYTVNTESLVGKPSSYFQNNNTTDWNNTGGFGGNTSNGFNQNANFGANPNYGATPTLQNQTPTPWNNTTMQTTSFDSAYQPNTSTEMQNAGGYDSVEAQRRAQILQAQRNAVNQILMNGMDVLYGMNRTINGMTFGGLDYLEPKLGFDSQMNNYLQLKNPQERELAQNVGQLIGYGGSALVGEALAKAGLNQANIAYNKLTQWNGRRNLTNQLQRGNNFKDIYMGKIDKDKLNTLNSVRRSEGAEFIPSRKVSIPKDRVQHIYEERIIGDGYTPKEAADTIYDAVFNPKSKIQASRYKTLQKFDSPTPNRAIVGKIRDGNSIFIKTGYRK